MEFFKYKNEDQRQNTNLLIIKLGENKTFFGHKMESITFGDYRLKFKSGFKSDGFFNVKSWNFGAPIFKKIKEEYIYIKNCKYIHGTIRELIINSNFSWRNHEKFYKLVGNMPAHDKFIGIISKKRGYITFIFENGGYFNFKHNSTHSNISFESFWFKGFTRYKGLRLKNKQN